MKNDNLCFLDMDGVIADFVSGACKAHKMPSPYDKPEALGVFEFEQLWGITPREFWKPLEFDGFWENLEKTPEADSLVQELISWFGVDNICVLSAPSNDWRCIP